MSSDEGILEMDTNTENVESGKFIFITKPIGYCFNLSIVLKTM